MKIIDEEERLKKITAYDREYWSDSNVILAGMDEVGRGPLAGPVCVACVIMPNAPLIPYINDSKKVSEKRRNMLFPVIRDNAIDYSIAWTSPERIDEINILEATRETFKHAFESMNVIPTDVMIDALDGIDIKTNQHILIHGDALCYNIAAASILAKVSRDNYMIQQDELYPQYGFRKNKGYGTAEHIKALKEYGPCPIHRKSFIKNFME